MEFTAVGRTAVSDVVFGQLVDAILTGRIAPEQTLPGERELAETFQVNRHAVREAVKRLQQSGLVRVSQGGRTRVLEWRTSAGLDILSALARSGAVPAQRILHDIAVMRRSIAADAARLCARHADDAQRAAVSAAARDYPDATEDFDTVVAGDIAFWVAILDGSGNLAYRLGLNTLVAGYVGIGMRRVAELGLGKEYVDPDAHRRLASAIADGAADTAYELAYALLSGLVEAQAEARS
ncbi:FadR/GntR family transcriptional regulator [Nocardia arizonensis]|uniref:FadR/GntR family transcriptional regulator n=1 Tax=Nocardia arizonensis TaxID=1141647 RepID=UPI0006D0652C|nr:GntR family transcriptional regulator [Nocardia arizonensis]